MQRSKFGITAVRIYLVATFFAIVHLSFYRFSDYLDLLGYRFLMCTFHPWIYLFQQLSWNAELLALYPLYVICNTGIIYFVSEKVEKILTINKR